VEEEEGVEEEEDVEEELEVVYQEEEPEVDLSSCVVMISKKK
jgi:hypothetical protein